MNISLDNPDRQVSVIGNMRQTAEILTQFDT